MIIDNNILLDSNLQTRQRVAQVIAEAQKKSIQSLQEFRTFAKPSGVPIKKLLEACS